jgi:hypothetical protein
MSDVQAKRKLRRQLPQDVEQAKGIGAARHADDNGLARGQQAVALDGMAHAGGQIWDLRFEIWDLRLGSDDRGRGIRDRGFLIGLSSFIPSSTW